MAIRRLFTGYEPDEQGQQGPGWKQYGYDIDHQVSTGGSLHCKNPEDQWVAHSDGEDGIDNAFGSDLVPWLPWDFSSNLDSAFAEGRTAYLARIDAIGSKPDYNPLPSFWYTGAALPNPPLWEGSDAWPVAPSSLEDAGNLDSAKVASPSAYLAGNVWVFMPEAALELELPLDPTVLRLRIQRPIVTLELAPDRQSGARGVIAGVLDRDEMAEEAARILAFFNAGTCSDNSLLEDARRMVRWSADILLDGSQDTDRECDAISIGLGFEAHAVALDGVGPAPSPDPEPDPCSASGGSGGGTP